jgi:type II secretory pathway pseudopilin PulG
MTKRRSAILLELILSIALFGVIAIITSNTLLLLSKKDHNSRIILNNSLILETTRLYLKANGLYGLKNVDNKLYFNNNLLLDNVTKFVQNTNNTIVTIDICIKNSICQKWIFNTTDEN